MTNRRVSSGLTRRACLTAAATLPLSAGMAAQARAGTQAAASDNAGPAAAALPAREEFGDIAGTYLNSGSVHPVARGARRAVEDYLQSRTMSGEPAGYSIGAKRRSVMEAFARLINAETGELAYIQSTSAGEQMAVRALGIPQSGGRIVTDALHFFGSFHLYQELEQAGMEVVIVRPRENRIMMEDLEAAVNGDTKLVAISAVSTINGFQHDLKAVADLAHAHGAHVFVDAIHAVGAVPLDVRASGIDFLSTSSYKWLMGDMGLGFMYARADLIPQLQRPRAGYYQIGAFQSHVYPYDEPGERAFEIEARDDAQGLFAMGTYSNTGVAHLDWSLNYIHALGVETIQAYRQPIIEHARRELPRFGLEPMTPEDSTSALISFARRDARSVFAERLEAAGVEVSLWPNRLRVSVSVFNTIEDIDRLVEALA
jgi:selenocysteine lyase/cysteine desulfurase